MLICDKLDEAYVRTNIRVIQHHRKPSHYSQLRDILYSADYCQWIRCGVERGWRVSACRLGAWTSHFLSQRSETRVSVLQTDSIRHHHDSLFNLLRTHRTSYTRRRSMAVDWGLDFILQCLGLILPSADEALNHWHWSWKRQDRWHPPRRHCTRTFDRHNVSK